MHPKKIFNIALRGLKREWKQGETKLDRLQYLKQKLQYPEHQPRERPSKDLHFMKLALEVAKRSPDAQTQTGCVIVSPDYRIISTGYNGYPRGIDYSGLPNTRPHKYPWFMHAEMNALAWCEHRPVDCIAYLTHPPCNPCLFYMHQCGIAHIIEPLNKQAHMMKVDKEAKIIREIFLELSSIKVEQMDLSLLDGV